MDINPENHVILIVDDTEANVRLLSHVLQKEGFNVESAANGTEGLEKIKSVHPDLILLDVMMPDKSGFEVCSIIKKDKDLQEIPVIFLSALSESDVKVEGFKSGGVDYITKPFQKEETLARIKTQLNMRMLQKKLNDRVEVLREREIELSRLNQRKDDLVRMVSHDIKNPLTGIIGLVGLLKSNKDLDQDERSNMFKVIEDSGKKLLDLVKDVLDKEAKKESPEKLELNKTDVEEIIDQVIQLNNAKAVNKNIDLIKNILTENPVAIIDAHKIEIVINNLVSNALKFTPSGGEVTISADLPSEDLLRLVVSDTGIGIAEEKRKSFFASAQKISTYGTGGETGVGLGLDIIKHYVDLHGGSINIDSEVDQGTSFIIQIPF